MNRAPVSAFGGGASQKMSYEAATSVPYSISTWEIIAVFVYWYFCACITARLNADKGSWAYKADKKYEG